MNFEWFFKMPGLFITGGVVLIIIALVVFLIGSKKGEQTKIEENNTESVPEIGKENSSIAVEQPNESVTPVGVAVEPVTPVTVEPVTVEPVTPVTVEPVTVEPVTPVAPEPVTVEPVAPVTPEPVTVEPTADTVQKPAGVEEI